MKKAGTVAGAASLVTYGLLSAIGVKMRGGKSMAEAGIKEPTPPVDPEVEEIYQEHLKRVNQPYVHSDINERMAWADAEQTYQDRFGPTQPFKVTEFGRQGPVSFGEMAAAPKPPELGIEPLAREIPELSNLIAGLPSPVRRQVPIYNPPTPAQPVKAGIEIGRAHV